MRKLDFYLKNKIIDNNKLIKYGFTENDGIYILKEKIFDEQFEMIVIFSDEEKNSKIIDIANGDEYILVDIQDSVRRICR